MFTGIKQKFKNNPHAYYSLSIAATWAGVGSLMVGIKLAQEYGIVPFLLWAFGNTLACMVFGIFAPIVPKLADVFDSKLMKLIVGLMCIFQVWCMMNGINEALSVIDGITARIITYFFAIFFIIILFKHGIIRNVLTDSASWISVYVVAFILSGAALYFGGQYSKLPLGSEYVAFGLHKCMLLIPGPFLYPYFHELLKYNHKNADGTQQVNIRSAFITGGAMFGAYLFFTFVLAVASLTPWMQIVKAILITLVGVSTLSSFQYSIYITFGRKFGLAANAFAVAGWYFLIPLGVMGAWVLMSSIRIYIVAGAIMFAIIWNAAEKRKAARA